MEYMNILEKIRNNTRADLMNKLGIYRRCALVRCTGFGKTWLLSDIAKEFNEVLYLYPSDAVRNTVVEAVSSSIEDDTCTAEQEEETERLLKHELRKSSIGVGIENIRFMSYAKLVRTCTEDMAEYSGCDLIIADEFHRAGGKLTRRALHKLLDECGMAKFIGATATPDRMDSYDVIKEFTNNVVVYPYTLHDAFQDGIVKRPYYCFCTYDIETDLKDEALTSGQDINDIKVKEVLDSALIEISKIYNMPSIVRDVVKQYRKDSSYMKFIVFFSGIQQMDDKGKDVEGWFRCAFPAHEVSVLIISSKNEEQKNNVQRLGELQYKKNSIDLIYCIDMLNMGYHVNDLTGLVMYRGTSSSIIYNQQLGRALSTGSLEPCIVFDVVDNLHRKCVYELYDKEQYKKTVRRKKNDTFHVDRGVTQLDFGSMTEEEIAAAKKMLDEQMHGKSGDDSDEGCDGKWWKSSNSIEEEDLYAVGNIATYRELIAKAVAEPIAQRCKRAQEEHYKRWCLMNDITYPNTRKELSDEKLMPPLLPYARWQNVTVRQILDTMAID